MEKEGLPFFSRLFAPGTPCDTLCGFQKSRLKGEGKFSDSRSQPWRALARRFFLGLLALLLASGLSGLSWCWRYVKDLEKRVATVSDVQDLQSRLAALEVRCAIQHHASSAQG